MHRLIYLKSEKASAVVVFIHGFMGSPRQFERLAEGVHACGFSAASLLLPGHGLTVKDFSASTAARWTEHVCAAVEQYGKEYEDIYLVGHSMGCLLALNAAARHPERVRGLFLLMCPFELKFFSMQALKVRFMQAFYSKKHPMKAAYLAGNGVPASPKLLWQAAGPARELKRLTEETRELLGDISAPVMAVYAVLDEMVAIGSFDVLKNGLEQVSPEYIQLEESLHAYLTEAEYEKVEAALLRFIDAGGPK